MEEHLTKQFFELWTGGAPSNAPLTALQVSPIKDFAVKFLINDPGLVVDQLELPPSNEEDVIIDARQIAGGSTAGPASREEVAL